MSDLYAIDGVEREIGDGWIHLESVPAGVEMDNWSIFDLSCVVEGRHLLLSLDKHGTRHLLVPVGRGHRPEPNLTSPLAVSWSRFDFGPESVGDYIDVHCRLPELNAQFHQVVVDLVEAVADAPEPVRAVSLVVARWRKLLGTLFASSVLPYQQRLSLFAELAVYEALLESEKVEVHPATWTGPDRSPHDFELIKCSVEVKAIGSDSSDITIHGFDQLARCGGKSLWLVVVQVEEVTGGRTLSALAQSLVDRTPSNHRGQLIRRLRLAGVPLGAGAADSLQFSVTRVFHLPVDEGVPRIIPEKLLGGRPDGIGRLEYTISLGSLESHPGSADGFPQLDCEGAP